MCVFSGPHTINALILKWKDKLMNVMNLGNKFWSVLTVISFALASQPAFAELNFCNKTPNTIWVAVNFEKNNKFVTRGWYKMESRKCITPISSSLSNRKYYYYAHDTEGIEWAGDFGGCTTNERMADISDTSCVAKLERKFKEINVGSRTKFTNNLTRSDGNNVSILQSELTRIGSSSSSGGDGTAAAVVLGLGVLTLFGLGADAARKNEEEACMRRCTDSKARCYELCTQ